MRLGASVCNLTYSTKPIPKEKEYIIPYNAGKRKWPLSGSKTMAKRGEGDKKENGKSEKEVKLDREAAEAVLKGV